MSQEHLGLFDTPPDRNEFRLGLAIVALLIVSLPIFLVIPDTRLREVNAFIPIVDVTMFLGDLITAALLYVHASVFRSRALTVLATGYGCSALMLIAHVLTFPGAFAPDGLLGAKINTTAWIGAFWRGASPIALIAYALLKRVDVAAPLGPRQTGISIALGLLAAVALAGAMTLLATKGHDLLPSFFFNRLDVDRATLTKVNWVMIALQLIAAALLFRTRGSVLDMWLLVSLAAWIVYTLLNSQAWGRFTVLFYAQFGVVLVANLIVLVALMAESSRLYLRLALTMAARNRERDARLMTMDALAAAIAHEVGQPLAAVSLNATAGLNSLKSERPDLEKVAKTLRAVLDAGRRTSDVIKSIRATFAKGAGAATEFGLNELVHETAGLLERELNGTKISLQLELDEALPPIRADRVQIQRVLINLVTNAIESLGATRRRARQLTIRSAPLDAQHVLLEVSDSGAGIAPEQMTRIFDAFFTTKASGTGLGLSLCRTIVEEHGGRLWASAGKDHGATFHLELPA